jgi:hypothetical protein
MGGFVSFSNCIASASYKSGIIFAVLVSHDLKWSLAFTSAAWTLTQSQKFPIVLSFDGRNAFNVVAVAMSADTVIVPMPVESSLIKSFRAAKTMSAFAQGSLFQFNLDGTAILLPALVTCVKTINANGISAAGDFTAPYIAARDKPGNVQCAANNSLQPAAGKAAGRICRVAIGSPADRIKFHFKGIVEPSNIA